MATNVNAVDVKNTVIEGNAKIALELDSIKKSLEDLRGGCPTKEQWSVLHEDIAALKVIFESSFKELAAQKPAAPKKKEAAAAASAASAPAASTGEAAPSPVPAPTPAAPKAARVKVQTPSAWFKEQYTTSDTFRKRIDERGDVAAILVRGDVVAALSKKRAEGTKTAEKFKFIEQLAPAVISEEYAENAKNQVATPE
jgi:hypothetical protein